MYKMKTVHKSDICSLVIILLFVLVIVQCKVIKSKECRMSGTGDNYRGTHKISSSGRKCKSWNQYYRQLEKKNFSGNNFKEYSRKLASSFCRNPDNNEGGPWCYVFEENSEGAEKEYCDIPFCIEKDCIVYARNNTVYSTIIKLSITAANITFWIKPWHSIEKQKTEARFLFSALPIPSSAKLISHSWKAGIEIVISNTVSGIIFSPKKEFHFEHTPKILSDSKWTGILISYTNGFISARIINSNKLLFQYQSNNKNNILSLYPNNFFFYGLMGTGIMLSTDSCMKSCDVYITFGMEFINIWPLHKQENTYSIFFNVRASHNILIRFYQVPTFAYPCVTIIMNENGRWTLFYQKSEKSLKQTLKIVINSISLNFWSWNAFTISIYGSFLRMYSNNLSIYEEMHVYNILFGSLRWFSIGSEEAISYWTLFCTPEIADVRRDSSPPNCLNNVADSYTGNQWTGAKGQPCVPWISNQIPKNEISVKLFIYHMIIKALNKCRNPSNDPVGPYCYTLPNFSKSYCPIKTCRSLECRVTGTANDYHGTLSVTRSGRVCATWFSKLGNTKLKGIGKAERNSSSSEVLSILRHKNSNFHHERTKRQGHMDEIKENLHFTSGETKKKSVSLMNNLHFNDTHSPQEMQNISNYCRNPSRSIAGTWCFTTDPSVSKDLCNVPDCEKPDECIFFVQGKGQGRKLYILPEYRSEGLRFSIKIWDPNKHDSITFVFMADGRSKSRYILKIGAGHNEKVLLYFQTELKALKLVKKKTLSHLMFLGKWSSFILRILHGRLELFYGNTINPLFEWQHPENEKPFSPIYYYHYSELGHTIGITFDCALNCHVENTETNRFTRLLPLLGYNFREYSYPHELQLLLRAKGRIFIPFFLLPSSAQYHLLTMDEFGKIIYFSKYTDKYIKVFHKQISRSLLYNSNHWTNITIRWLNHTISVFSNNTPVFNYIHSSPLLFYYFSLAVSEGGWVTWTTNCIPPDIEGTARDGGWSEWGEWFCSYSCRNGVGARRRICNSPKPNIRGEACLGTSVIMSRCNNIACDDITEAEKHQRFNHMKHYTNYTLNVGTLRNIKLKLRRNHTSIVANEGEMIILYKDYDTIDKVIKESPHSQIKWTQNGLYFLEEQGRKEIMDHNVVVRKCTMQDSGVYTMTIRRIDETQIIIKIISLAIIPVKSSIIIQKGFPIHIMCHCSMLGYVYTDLNIHWSINEKVWMDYGTTLPIAVNNGIILQSNATHNGFWKCIVAQNDLGLQWTTNVLLIKDPPNWRNHLMEDKVTKLIIFAWMSNNGIVAVLLILLLITITCTIAYSKELLQLII